MNSRTMIGALALVTALAGFVQAETWYFTGNETSTDLNAWTDPTVWKDANGTAATAFNAADSYVLTNFGPGEAAATLHTIRAHGGTFANGARLELNAYDSANANRKAQNLYVSEDCTMANPATFPRGLLFGHNAHIYARGTGTTNVIDGTVEMIAVNGGQSPYINGSDKNETLVFKGKMTGSTSGRAVLIYPASGATQRNFTVKFLDDVTWDGCVYLRDQNTAIDVSSCDFNTRLVFGNITFKPYFRADGKRDNAFNAHTLMRFAVDTVDDTVTLKNGLDYVSGGSVYPFHCDTYLEFPVDAQTGKAGKMVLETQFHGRTNEWIGVILTGDLFGGTATNRFELMSVPVAYPLNAAAFHLANDQGLDGAVVKFEVVNDATWSTLYAVVPPMVRYLKCDGSSQNANRGTFIESAEGWSDGSTPQPGRNYLVLPTNKTEMILRPPDSDISASYTFPGDSLTIASNASLRCYLHTLNVKDLRMLDGSALYCSRCGSSAIDFNGNIDISGRVRVGTYNNYYMNFTNCTFTGSGTIDFGGLWIADNALANYRLGTANPDFTGKMIVRTAYRDDKSVPAYNADYGMLHIWNANVLGADLPMLTPDAITVTDYAFLWVDRSTTLAKASNRGVTIKDCGRIWQSSNVDFRMETMLTVDGECYKDGTGVLTLAGEAAAVTGGGADKFFVTNGTLCVASANALKGLALHFYRGVGTAFRVLPNLDDDEFTEKGLDLSDLDTPLSLAPEVGSKIPFQDTPAANRPEAPFGTTEYGVFTVKATFADTLRAMLPAKPPRHFAGGTISWMETSTEDSVTFGVRCARHATRIHLR